MHQRKLRKIRQTGFVPCVRRSIYCLHISGVFCMYDWRRRAGEFRWPRLWPSAVRIPPLSLAISLPLSLYLSLVLSPCPSLSWPDSLNGIVQCIPPNNKVVQKRVDCESFLVYTLYVFCLCYWKAVFDRVFAFDKTQ